MRRFAGTGCWAFGGICLASASAFGLEPADVLVFSKGAFSLRPHMDVNETFNDNIYYEEKHRDHDFITTVSPGVTFQLGREEENYINVSYTYDRLQYLLETSQNTDQHRIATGTNIEFNRLTLTGRDQIEFLSSVLGGGISLQGRQVDRTTYFDEYRLTYAMTERTGVYVEGQYNAVDWERGIRLFDSNTLIGTGGFEYKAFSRSLLFGEIYYGQTATTPNFAARKPPHATFIGGFVGARGNFTEKMTGMVKAGFESREFADGTTGANQPVVEATIMEQFSEKTLLAASYSRRQRVSVQFERGAYTIDAFSVSLRQDIGYDGRMHALVRGSYALADYEKNPAFDKRTDHLVGAGAELTYDFKIWLRGRLGYDYEHLDSNLGGIVDYDVNRVTLGISIGY